MNALKHGMRSRKLALLREDSVAFENRRMKWMATADAQDDMEEFLVSQNVSLSFELEQLDQARLERITAAIESADDDDFVAVHQLGKRLFFDPSGPTPMYGNRPEFDPRPHTSWNRRAVDPDDPALLVRSLESSEAGCRWLRALWEELRAQLEPGKFWQSHDRFKATRLLGRQPVDALEDRRIAEIFVASNALEPGGRKPFEELDSDMDSSALARHRHEVAARWPDLVSAAEPDKCRQLLLDLVDRNIERIDAKLEVHEENADSDAERAVARLGFDSSPDGERIRHYRIKCLNAFYRGLDSYRKHHGKPKPEREHPRFDRGGPVPDYSRFRTDDSGRWARETRSSDHLPDRSFVAENARPAECEQPIASGPLPDRGPEPESENRTNEANFAENVRVVQNQVCVGVAAKVEVDSGLDKRVSGQLSVVSCQWSGGNDGSTFHDGLRSGSEPSDIANNCNAFH
jgi:hypothetical protein